MHKPTKYEILNSSLYIHIANQLRDLKKMNYISNSLLNDGVIIQDRYKCVDRCRDYGIYDINDLYNLYGYNVVNAIQTFIDSGYRRKNRLKERIEMIVYDALARGINTYFITMTFNNDCINTLSMETRRKYIQRFLKMTCVHYVANQDFGESNEYTHREHYHACASSYLSIEQLKDAYKMGFIDIQIVRLSTKNPNGTMQRLAKYIAKLTNHACKESNKRNCFIYDRNKEYML